MRAAVCDHLQKTPAAVLILQMLLQMRGKLVYLLRQKGNLDLRRAGVPVMNSHFFGYFSLFLLGKHVRTLSHPAIFRKRWYNIVRRMATHNLKQLKNQFLEYLEIEKGRSVKTVENYDRYLTRYLAFSKVSSPTKITEQSVREFRIHLNRQAGTSGTMKHKTQNYYMISLRAFLKFLRKRDVESLNPERIELAKVGQRDLDLITSDELNRLINVKGTSLPALRDRAILELFFSTGLRVSELCALNRDIDLSRDEFSVRGKGEKVRVVFLSAEAKAAIRAYEAKRADVEEALFISTSNPRLTPRSIERIVKGYAIKAGITRKVTPHVI